MENQFSTKLKIIFVWTVLIFLISIYTAHTQTICYNEVNTQGDYTYEFWRDSGTGCMVLGDEGAFSIEWSDIHTLLVRKGLRPGSWDNIITYAADYQPEGNSYLCAYGWTDNPHIEYYIVESWGTWRPPGGDGYMDTFNSDGGTYEIFQTQRVAPSLTYMQYWSVRQSKHTSGIITVGNHFKAWENLGMEMGDLTEVSFCVEGYQSSGTADVYIMSISNVSPEPTQTPTDNENGDVDSNGVIDIIDALIIAKYSVGLVTPGIDWDLADTNCDGLINIIDALNIARFTVNLISYIPECIPPNLELAGSLKSDVGTRYGWKTTSIKEEIMYVAGVTGKMQLFDISGTPQYIKEIDLNGISVYDMTINGNNLYLSYGRESSFQIYDITLPREPVFLGQKTLSDSGRHTFSGHYAYECVDRKFEVYDLGDPAEILKVGEVTLNTMSSSVNDIYIKGENAFVPYYDGLIIVDISDPATPRVNSSLSVGDLREALVAFNEDYAFCSDDNQLYIINITDPSQPVLEVSQNTGITATELTIAGNNTLILCSDEILYLMNVSNPHSPVLQDSYELPIWANKLYYTGNILYVVYSFTGDYYYPNGPFGSAIEFFDVNTSGSFVSLYTIDGSGFPTDIAIEPPYAYLADGKSGIKIIDISDPAGISQIGSLKTEDAMNLVVAGNILYLADGPGGVKTIDISNPSAPILLDSVQLDIAKDIALQGSYAYVADYPEGLSIVDISDPSHLQVTYKVPNPNDPGYDYNRPKPKKVLVSGNYTFLLKNQSPELVIHDVSDPLAPYLAAEQRFSEQDSFIYTIGDLLIKDNLLYVLAGDNKLNILDISEPATPLLLGTDYLARLYRIALYKNYMFGITESTPYGDIPDSIIAEVSNPAGLIQAGAFRIVDAPSNVAVKNGYLYITSKTFGPDLMWVYKIE